MFSAAIDYPDGTLRLLEDRHVDELYACVRRNLDHLGRWMPWATEAYSLEGCRQWQRSAMRQYADNDGLHAGVFLGDTLAGVIGLHGIDWANRKTTFGYWLDHAHQGRGLMTAATRRLLDHLFHDLKLCRAEVRCGVENARSRGIPTRLGFVQEGILRQCEQLPEGRVVDQVVYSMLADEWVKFGNR